MKKQQIKEIYFVRSIACLCVVLLHSITRVVNLYGVHLDGSYKSSLMTIRLLLTFGTPIFIFLSEFLVAYTHPENVPKGFLRAKFKSMVTPYLTMALLYSILMSYEKTIFQSSNVVRSAIIILAKNILFGFYYHGYFMIVIFQFYLLHLAFHRYLKQAKPKKVLLNSLLINIAFLGFFNFIKPFNIPYGEYLWRGLSWGAFLSWIFYFTLGYYCGTYYDAFKKQLKEIQYKVMLLPILTGGMVLYLYLNNIVTENSSKRFDIVFFATSMLFLLWYIGMEFNPIPKFIAFISRYSFSIYLLHMLCLSILLEIIKLTNYLRIKPITILLFLFIGSTLGSVGLTGVMGKLSLGKYVGGRAPSKSIPRQKAYDSIKGF